MRKDRLLKLADYLDTVPASHFDMSLWGITTKACGFSGCAIGWACHAKLFDGFVIRNTMPQFDGESDWHAIDRLFEFDHDAGDPGTYLFSDNSYPEHQCDPTPSVVAARIRDFVKSEPA